MVDCSTFVIVPYSISIRNKGGNLSEVTKLNIAFSRILIFKPNFSFLATGSALLIVKTKLS